MELWLTADPHLTRQLRTIAIDMSDKAGEGRGTPRVEGSIPSTTAAAAAFQALQRKQARTKKKKVAQLKSLPNTMTRHGFHKHAA